MGETVEWMEDFRERSDLHGKCALLKFPVTKLTRAQGAFHRQRLYRRVTSSSAFSTPDTRLDQPPGPNP